MSDVRQGHRDERTNHVEIPHNLAVTPINRILLLTACPCPQRGALFDTLILAGKDEIYDG